MSQNGRMSIKYKKKSKYTFRMCILSGTINTVSRTKIFGMPSKDGTRQLTVYTNAVDTPETNVMCLPVPNPHTVNYETVPKELFKQCKESFPDPPPPQAPPGQYWLSASRSYDEPIEIKTHGSYEVALVPSLYDFHRIPETFAKLSFEVKQYLFNSYPPEYGVLLCKLKKGLSDYEPFAYSHEIVNQSLFLPTKHYHIHEDKDFVSGRSQNQKTLTSSSTRATIGKADWDHDMYLCYTPPFSLAKKSPVHGNQIGWKEIPKEFCVGPDYSLQRIQRKGAWFPNEDIRIPLIV